MHVAQGSQGGLAHNWIMLCESENNFISSSFYWMQISEFLHIDRLVRQVSERNDVKLQTRGLTDK